MLRRLPRLCRSLSTTEAHFQSTPASIVTASSPPTAAPLESRSGQSVHVTPSTLPTQSTQSTQPIHSTQPRQSDHFAKLAQSAEPSSHQPPTDPTSQTTSYAQPPFRTHRFFTTLEKTFPPSTARSLMRATRSLLVNRMDKAKGTGLTTQDLENKAYLFRAALSDLRAELTLRSKNESAAIRTTNAALRREVDTLDVTMMEDVAKMKHEIQMEVDTRKNETRTEFKQQAITIEEVQNKAIVSISELRTLVEENKWENMRKSVLTMTAFLLFVVLVMELRPKFQMQPKKASSEGS